MKEFWNQRYAAAEYAYGTEPNVFFKAQLDRLSPGRILLPAEGEGRNAVYAARQGWQVAAYDISEVGKEKALRLAEQQKVNIHYQVGKLEDLDYLDNSFDAIGLIFAHLPPNIRPHTHRRLSQLLRPGGYIILEAFSKEHLTYNQKNPQAGGPKDIALLYDSETLQQDFPNFEFQILSEKTCTLQEGKFHLGESAVMQMLARRRPIESVLK